MNMNIFTNRKGTSRLRELRDAALIAVMNNPDRDKRLFMIEKEVLHFFEDCCIAFIHFEIGRAVVKEGEYRYKTLAVYTRDLKEWKPYKDQFEPKEGYHHAYEYSPHDASFPTKEW